MNTTRSVSRVARIALALVVCLGAAPLAGAQSGNERKPGSIGNTRGAFGGARVGRFPQPFRTISRREAERNAQRPAPVPPRPIPVPGPRPRPRPGFDHPDGHHGDRDHGRDHGHDRGGHHGDGVIITSGSGLVVDGSFHDDNFNLGIHLGASPVRIRHHHDDCFDPCDFPHFPRFFGGFGFSDFYYPSYGRRYSSIDGGYYAIDPALAYQPPAPVEAAPTEPVDAVTDRELADLYLRAGDTREAIAMYRRHLERYPSDAEAMRSLGIALLADNDVKEGVAVIGMAYRTDPRLAADPIPRDLFESATELRRAVSKVSVYANRVETGSAWLALAALMQAEGRTGQARTMVERARAAGLEAEVTDTMLIELR